MGGQKEETVDRKPRILVFSGDMGGANVEIPIYLEFKARGVSPTVVTDADLRSKAGSKWDKKGIPFTPMSPGQELEDLIMSADIVLAGNCATANDTEIAAVEYANKHGKLSVVIPDSWTSHSRPNWLEVNPSYWIAIDKSYQEDFLSHRMDWTKDRVPVLGHPGFDNLVGLMENSGQIRRELRDRLEIGNHEKVLLHWTPGENRDFCTAGFVGLLETIGIFRQLVGKRAVLIPRLHGKMKTSISEDYYNTWHEAIAETCKNWGVRLVRADDKDIDVDGLNLAADIVTTQWSTQGVTSAIMGVPTVNVLLNTHRKFLENMGKEEPYLPTLYNNVSEPCYEIYKLGMAIRWALDTRMAAARRKNAKKMMPKGDSAKSIAEFLMERVRLL